jgi:hypothetical protein
MQIQTRGRAHTLKRILFVALAVTLSVGRVEAQESLFIPFFEQRAVPLAPQQDMFACWAAAMSAALLSKGVYVSQDDIKLAATGSLMPDTLKNPWQLTMAFDRLRLFGGRLNTMFVSVPAQAASWDEFKRDIRARNPHVVGYWTGPQTAHLIVVYGITFDRFGNAEYKIWDPAPGAGLGTLPVAFLARHVWFFVALRDVGVD